MDKKNIAIFENEQAEIEGAFEYLNLKYYNGGLDYKFFPSSQSFGDLEALKAYDLVIVDIDLSSKSELDGFRLIQRIENTVSPVPNILIITGHAIEKGFETQYGIRPYRFLEKPLNFRNLKSEFDKWFH